MADNQKDSFSIPAHFTSIKEAAEFWRLCKEYWDVVEELEFEVNSPYCCDDLTSSKTPEVHKSSPKPA
ncbi:MAG: hypothetical protein U0401_06250 [Anaerolineae bacterium]